MGTQCLHPKKGTTASPTAVHLDCGQTAGWIKMPLRSSYEGRPRPRQHCVTWGCRHSPPIFGPCLLCQTVAHLCYCWALAKLAAVRHHVAWRAAFINRWSIPVMVVGAGVWMLLQLWKKTKLEALEHRIRIRIRILSVIRNATKI